jgi:tetratricopeptide (TPR) repeat protein
MGPAPARPRRLPLALGLAVPLALAALSYARVLDGEFQLDDLRTIDGNPAIRDPGAAARAALAGAVRGGGRPLTDLTFALDRARSGPGPRSFHVTSLVLHLAVAGLVLVFTRRVLRLAGAARPDAVAVAVAGLFALHPLQTEAVSYLSQRSEVLSSGLFLATLLLLLAAEERGRTARGAAAWLGSVATFGLALAAKPIAVTLPAAYALLTWAVPSAAARAGLARWRERAGLLVPLAALAAVHAARTLAGTRGSADAGFSVPGLSPGTYLATQARVVATYLRLLLWPAGQNADWDFRASRSLADPAVLGAAALLAALAAGAVALARRAGGREGSGAAAARVAAFGLLWFLVLLSPTSSVVPLADVLAEHRVYLASWGILVALAAGAERLLGRVAPRRAAPAGIALVLAAWTALAVATHRRNAVWETRLAFWSDAAARSPGKARVHLGLGEALSARGDLDGALLAFGRALAVVGENRVYEARVLRNVAVAHARAGRLDAAVEAYGRSLARDPSDPDALAGFAVVQARRGDLGAAEALAARALATAPDHPDALDVLGGLRMDRGDPAGAAALFERAARVDPDDGVHLLGLGFALRDAGRAAEACAAWRSALGLRLDGPQRALAERARAAAGCR